MKKHRIQYILGVLVSIPLLPIMYFQGKRIRKKVPSLPEAKNPEGSVQTVNSAEALQVLAIGESTIAGVGVERHADGFTGALAESISKELQINVSWKVVARSGYTAKQVTQRLLPKTASQNPDIIVIGLGGNDAFTLNSPWSWRKHMRELILQLQNQHPDATVIFSNMPPIKAFPAFTWLIKFIIGNLVEILGDELNDLVADFSGVYYADEIITIAGWIHKVNADLAKSDFFSDGVHPSQLTYQVWGNEMGKICADQLEKKNT